MNGLIQQRPFASPGTDGRFAWPGLDPPATPGRRPTPIEQARGKTGPLSSAWSPVASPRPSPQPAARRPSPRRCTPALALVHAPPLEPTELADIAVELAKLDAGGVTDGPAVIC